MLSLLSLLTVFSAESIKASALSGGRWLSTSESLQVFGASFEVTYYNGSDYVQTIASYTDGTRTLQSAAGEIPAGVECLQYTAPVVDLSHNPEYITCDIRPLYSVFGTTQIHTAVFAYCTTPVSTPPYQSPDWRWLVSGSEQVFHGTNTNNVLDTCYVASDMCIYVNADISSQSTFTASSERVTFVAPLSVYNGKLYFYLAPVYVSNDASASNGTTTTTTSGGSGGSSPDMSETNGLLGSLLDLIRGIPAAIAHIFIPTAEELTEWRESIAELLEDTFGDIPALHDQLETAIDNIIGVNATESITFPGISPPGVGEIVPPQAVSLRPAGFDSLFTMIRFAVDIICTIWVFNMLQDKMKAFLVGETVVCEIGD